MDNIGGNSVSISSEVKKKTNTCMHLVKCNMSQKVWFIKLLLLRYATQILSLNANCHEDVPVMCPGVDLDSMDYISVAWYKLINKSKLGIIRRSRDNKTTQYNFDRSPEARFGEKHSLLLLKVTPKDSGTYECDISANVGGQNRELTVNLVVRECVTQPVLLTMPPMLNTTELDLHCNKQVELPVMWSIISYLIVGLVKIVLSLICVWVFRTVRMRSSRRRQKW